MKIQAWKYGSAFMKIGKASKQQLKPVCLSIG
jgi:hypothetical protein